MPVVNNFKTVDCYNWCCSQECWFQFMNAQKPFIR
jgi:hypothetical protein